MKKGNIKIIAITALITALLVGGTCVAAVSLTAKDIKFTSTNEGWETDNVEDAVNDLYVIGQNKKNGVVFTSSPVDMKQYTDRWNELTTADFKVGCAVANARRSGAVVWEGGGGSISASPAFSYDKNTGLLTFSDGSNAYTDSEGDSQIIASTSGVFVVWLGTVGGK